MNDVLDEVRQHIARAFWKYHAENPHELFKKYARELKNAGRMNYGSGAIFERIRWHLAVETRGDEFKLNNNYRSCYSRLFVHEHPEFTGFFRTRTKQEW